MRDTSIKTYHQIINEGILGANQLRVLRAISFLGFATDREIANYLNFKDPNMVRPRRKELLDMRIISDYGKRSCKVTGRESYVWGICNKIYFKPLK